jgi:hypothetical protein
MTIVVTPSNRDVPLITDVPGTPEDIAERARAVFKTAEFLEGAGAVVDVTLDDEEEARAVFMGGEIVKKDGNGNEKVVAPQVVTTLGAAVKLRALVTKYDEVIIDSAVQARTYIMNRLLEISDPDGDAKIGEQLRALELMGKVSEVGMFTERVEVNINNKTTEDLEAELVSTLAKYMGNAVTVSDKNDPILGIDLDEELGRTIETAAPVAVEVEKTDE